MFGKKLLPQWERRSDLARGYIGYKSFYIFQHNHLNSKVAPRGDVGTIIGCGLACSWYVGTLASGQKPGYEQYFQLLTIDGRSNPVSCLLG